MLSSNRLLQGALADEQWVLWLDADLVFYPSTLIQDLLSQKGLIVAPNCMYYAPNNEVCLH
jgi:hypothetical protein